MTMKAGQGIIIVITLSSVLSANYGPQFNVDRVEVNVIAGQTAVLPCSALHRGDFKIIWLNPKSILFSHGTDIAIDDRRVSVETNDMGDWNLRIKHVQHNDSGEYMCQINTKPVKIKRVRLNVLVPPHIFNDGSSRDLDVEEGDDVALVCKATGIPQPNITWFIKPLEAAENKEYLNIEGETLYIKAIKRYQSGHYVCIANNGVPPVTTREMLVKVQYKPIVKLLNSRLGQILGKETILECSVTSHPRAKITWFKNGVPIQHSYKYRLELYQGRLDTYTLTLQIMYINKFDYGDYTCIAENRMGKAKATMVLYEYKEPTSRTEPVTTHVPNTSRDEDEYNEYESEEYYGYDYRDNLHRPEYKDNLPLSDLPGHNNKFYFGRTGDRSDYLRDRGLNKGNSPVVGVFPVLMVILCTVLV